MGEGKITILMPRRRKLWQGGTLRIWVAPWQDHSDSTLQVLSQSFVSQHRVATLGAWRGLQILKSQRASVL